MKIKFCLKKALTILAFANIIPSFHLNAQAQYEIKSAPPYKMSYQAIIRNENNQLITNQTVKIKVSILKGSVNGFVVYSETHAPTCDANGLVTLEIGMGTETNGYFANINWADNDYYYIKTETDPKGGTNYTITASSQLLSVPYAFHSFIANTVPGFENLKVTVHEMFDQLISMGVIMADADGNYYSTVRIGPQIWMAENLRTTKFNDGAQIPQVTEDNAWLSRTEPAYCFYSTSETYKKLYGALYNWYAVNTEKLCPTGWRVPSESDWYILIRYLAANGYNYDGSIQHLLTGGLSTPGTTNYCALALATTRSTWWQYSSDDGAPGNNKYLGKRNTTGFSGFPAGYRNGPFYKQIEEAWWWTSSQDDDEKASSRCLKYGWPNLAIGSDTKQLGFSVRCVKD